VTAVKRGNVLPVAAVLAAFPGGIDHLLFMLGLTLIVRVAALLVKTITAFTVAHSLTLAAATVGFAPAYAIGSLAAFWLIERVAGFG
jgi:hypothetical protein